MGVFERGVEMNPKERVMQRLKGKPCDRIPNTNIIMQFAASQIGVKYGKYVTDYRELVRGNLYCCEKYGIDMVSAISDPMREASGFGADVYIPEDDVPYADPIIKEYGDLKKIRPCNPMDSARMEDRIKAIELYKREVGDEYPILGWVEGCVAEAADLRGLQEIMMDMYDEPEFVEELMEICLEQAVAFARCQVEAGADFIGVGDAASSLIGPALYEKYAAPFQSRLLSAIREMGAYTKLHICGNIEPVLHLIPARYVDILDIDWMVDWSKAVDMFGDKLSLSGNYDPVAVLLDGKPEDVKKAVKDCALRGGNRCMSSAGCEVPRNTPVENVIAIHEALKELAV